MAQIKWQKRAERELYRYLVKGFLEFGETTANRFADRVGYINNELVRFPEIGFPEPLLRNRRILYRAYHINNRFKIIYSYTEESDTVHMIYGIQDVNLTPSSKESKQSRKLYVTGPSLTLTIGFVRVFSVLTLLYQSIRYIKKNPLIHYQIKQL